MTQFNPQKPRLPFKSIAVALCFSVFFGPIGLLYSSLIGGVLLTIIGLVAIKGQFLFDLLLVWVASCVWSVWSANRYNAKMLEN